MGENNIQLYNLQYTVAVCYNILDSFQKSFSYKTQNGQMRVCYCGIDEEE